MSVFFLQTGSFQPDKYSSRYKDINNGESEDDYDTEDELSDYNGNDEPYYDDSQDDSDWRDDGESGSSDSEPLPAPKTRVRSRTGKQVGSFLSLAMQF